MQRLKRSSGAQVLEMENSLSVKEKYEERPRVCNLGYLRTA
jgi:hypothetical protein